MRPNEIRHLKVKNIDEISRHIRIVGKTGDRLIPISDQLMKLIQKRGLLELSSDHYVFGMVGMPAKERLSIQFFLEKYNVIKDNLKLEAIYKIYSWKPTGVIAMINAGFEDKQIMVLTGHKTQKAFEAYKRGLVIDNSCNSHYLI